MHTLPKLRRSTFKTDCPDLSSHLHSFFKLHGEVKGVDGTKDVLSIKGLAPAKEHARAKNVEPYVTLLFSSPIYLLLLLLALFLLPLSLPLLNHSSSSSSIAQKKQFTVH